MPDVSTGEVIAASHINNLRDGTDIEAAAISTDKITNPYKFKAYLGTNQTSVGDGTKIQFDTESYDLNTNYDNATNYRYTAPVNGYYLVNCQLVFSSPTDQVRYGVDLKLNGSSTIHLHLTQASGTSAIYSLASSIHSLSAGDYLEVFASITSGTATAVAGEHLTFFQAHLLSE